MPTFLSDEVWPRLRALSRRRSCSALVAVPFIGSRASERLPLRRGDILVTKFDRAAIASGHVDPREIVGYIKKGVEVHSVRNLHAKVYVFGRIAIVGSANVSASSERQLKEAACECDDRRVVSASREFVLGLRGEAVELEYAKSQIRFWRPPRRGPYGAGGSPRTRTTTIVEQSEVVAVSLESVEFDETDSQECEHAHQAAHLRIADSERFRLDDFRWTGAVPKTLRRGVRVVMCTSNPHGRVDIAAPCRVLEIRKYRSRRGARRAIVVVEVRKHLREKPFRDVLKAVGPEARELGAFRGAFRQIRRKSLIYALGQLWPSA